MTNLLKLLPHSLKMDVFNVACAEAFEMQLIELREEFNAVCDLVGVNTNNEQLIDFLAYEKHVDFYEGFTLDEKRDVVRNNIELHAKKGTKHALNKVLQILDLNGGISEWFDYDGEPYHFKADIDISKKGISEFQFNWLENLLTEYKNARSIIELIQFNLHSHNTVHLASNTGAGEMSTLYPNIVRNIEQSYMLSVTPATTSGEKIRVNPYELKNIDIEHSVHYATGAFFAEQTTVFPSIKEVLIEITESFIGTQIYSAENIAAYPR